MSLIPALGRGRQENQEFKVNLGYNKTASINKSKNKERMIIPALFIKAKKHKKTQEND